MTNIKRIQTLVPAIRRRQAELESSSNEELKSLFQEMGDGYNLPRMNSFDSRDLALITSFAITTILIERLLGLKLYDVQLQGALALHSGQIAEMKTGEGKTVTSAVAIAELARVFNGSYSVHVATVNEYLAERDMKQLKPVYEALGLTVSLNLQDTSPINKQKAYLADIVYSTPSEFGFDYLRDNMVMDLKDKLNQKDRAAIIIDEIDMILIDEAKTPLIIAKNENAPTHDVMRAELAFKSLSKEDYTVNLKEKNVQLTSSGFKKINEYYNVSNILDGEHRTLFFRLSQALNAHLLYHKDRDYAIINNEIIIIDLFTGRLQHGRRFSYGLHQALEAKHVTDGVEVKGENATIATITLQNFIRDYWFKAGMTGTATKEAKEFLEVYNLPIAVIPTNKPYMRVDYPVQVFRTIEEKDIEILSLVKGNPNPFLIGTTSVEDSERLSAKFKEHGIKHNLLNAKQDEAEALIISQAGIHGTVTIATNMAGRGTDIIVEKGYELEVIVTELNESSRIDDQLKGRTARQGAVGIVHTLVSLEDKFFDKMDKQTKEYLLKAKGGYDTPSVTIPHGQKEGTIFSKKTDSLKEKIIRSYQQEIESLNESAREQALMYDNIINNQRQRFYSIRNHVLIIERPEMLLEPYSTNPIIKENVNRLMEETSMNMDLVGKIIRNVVLYALDKEWVEHMKVLDLLKHGISWRSYSGQPGIVAYSNECARLYQDFKDKVGKTLENTMKDLKIYNTLENAYEGAVEKRGIHFVQ